MLSEYTELKVDECAQIWGEFTRLCKGVNGKEIMYMPYYFSSSQMLKIEIDEAFFKGQKSTYSQLKDCCEYAVEKLQALSCSLSTT